MLRLKCGHWSDNKGKLLQMQGHLIVTGNSKGVVEFWNRETCQLEAAIQAHDAPINAVAYLSGHFYTASR